MLCASAESPVVRTWDFTEALVKQEQAQRAKQARANHKQQQRLRAQAAALAALNPSDGSSPADEEAMDGAGQLAGVSASQPEDPSSSIADPAVDLRTAGAAHDGAWHEREQQSVAVQRGASASKVSSGSHPASNQHMAASHHASSAVQIIPSSQQGPADEYDHGQEDQPGNAWAVDGSRAHQGRSHFQAWHTGSHSGAGHADPDHGHGASYPLSSSPQLPWGGDPHDPSASNGCFEDELDEGIDEWGVDDLRTGSSGTGGSRRRHGARLSHAASLGPHEGCNAEEGCDGHCCSLNESSSGVLWGATVDYRSQSHRHQDASGIRTRQHLAYRSSSNSGSSHHSHREADLTFSRGRRRGAYGTSPILMPIRCSGGGANAASGGRPHGSGPRSASTAAARQPHEPCRLEAAGMQSWQIVRPRPVACREQG